MSSRLFRPRRAGLLLGLPLAIGAALAAAAPSAAEASKSDRRANGAFRAALLLSAHDRNGDGRLARSELADTGTISFDALDRNEDGYLAADELRAWSRRYERQLRRDYRRNTRLEKGLYARGYIKRMRRRRARD